MTTYAEDLHAWLRSRRAECAERAESPGTTPPATGESHSAHCAHSARSDRGAASGLSEGFGDWAPDAQDLFHERLGIAAELGMALQQGSSAWMIAPACTRSALRFAGGRVGMSTAMITAARVACSPAS